MDLGKKLVSLTFTWILDPADSPWSHMVKLEDDLAKFLGDKGLEGKKVDFVNGFSGQATYILTKKPPTNTPEHQNKPIPVGKALDNLSKNLKKGKK